MQNINYVNVNIKNKEKNSFFLWFVFDNSLMKEISKNLCWQVFDALD